LVDRPWLQNAKKAPNVPLGDIHMTLRAFTASFPTSYSFNNVDVSMDNTNSGLDSSMMGFHNDGCDLVLSSTAYPFERIAYNDAAECVPSLIPDGIQHISLQSDLRLVVDSANESNLGLGQPYFGIYSSNCDGFDLGSSLLACTFVNDDSDFNLYPLWQKVGTLLMKICQICQG
jgi:hypothetical protein